MGSTSELLEEFGTTAAVGEHLTTSLHDDGRLRIELMAFQVAFTSGDPLPLDHDEIRWVKPEELPNLDLAPADVPIAGFLARWLKGG